ncbi:MAG: redoxin family protein [Bacteroidota bacterium]
MLLKIKSLLSCLLLCALLTTISYAQSSVHLAGSSDGKAEKYLSVRVPDFFIGENSREHITQQNSESGDFAFSFNLDKPQTLLLSAFYKNWFIQFKPGDSLKFNITGQFRQKKLTFYGKNAERYNFDVLVNDLLESGPLASSKSKDYVSLKSEIENWRKTTLDTVNAYVATYKIDKKDADMAKVKIGYRYAFLFYYTLYVADKTALPEQFFQNANQISFDKDELLYLQDYRSTLSLKYIGSKRTDQSSNLSSLYQDINKLKGSTKNYATALLAGNYAVKQAKVDSAMLRKIFDNLAKKKLDSSYTAYLRDKEMKYFIIGQPLPQDVLDETFLTNYESDNEVSLATILDTYKGKALYIDLWASWCIPCRDDIAKSTIAKNKLAEKGIQYLYVSTDTDSEKWRKGAKEDKITDNQFRLLPGKFKKFKDFTSLGAIPRYILLDNKHHVVNLFAPRPTPTEEKEFQKLLGALPNQSSK